MVVMKGLSRISAATKFCKDILDESLIWLKNWSRVFAAGFFIVKTKVTKTTKNKAKIKYIYVFLNSFISLITPGIYFN